MHVPPPFDKSSACKEMTYSLQVARLNLRAARRSLPSSASAAIQVKHMLNDSKTMALPESSIIMPKKETK